MSISMRRVGALVLLIPAVLVASAAEPPPNKVELARQNVAFLRGLEWLAAAQADDGRWSLINPQHDVAATALGVLPLLRTEDARSTPGREYAVQADRGLKYIIARQGEDGGFGMGYYHGLASLALCEAYALTGDPTLEGPARKAVNYIINAQGPNGGWRYVARQDGDTSITAWMMQALAAAERGGLAVPKKTWEGAAAYLDTVAGKEGGYGYTTPAATPRMTASGCLCRLILKTPDTDPHFQKSVKILKALPPRADHQNVYYYYHATAVFTHLGAGERQPWQAAVDKVLLEKQDKQGKDAGSWPETGDAFGSSSGRVMTTALSLLMLHPPSTPRPQLGVRPLQPAEVAAQWDDLAKHTPVQALESMRVLVSRREETVPFLRQRLQPPAPLDPKALARLVKELDDERFAVRQKATAELARLGELAVPALRQALEGKPSLEVSQRIEGLLLAATSLTPERIQALRGVRVLERTGGAAAREALEELARGEPALLTTTAAADALQRLKNPPTKPAN